MAALLRAVLSQQVHHTEFECLALLWGEVEGDLEHVIDGCGHDEGIVLLHHETVKLAEV